MITSYICEVFQCFNREGKLEMLSLYIVVVRKIIASNTILLVLGIPDISKQDQKVTLIIYLFIVILGLMQDLQRLSWSHLCI